MITYIEFWYGELKGVIRDHLVGVSHAQVDGNKGSVELFTLATLHCHS